MKKFVCVHDDIASGGRHRRFFSKIVVSQSNPPPAAIRFGTAAAGGIMAWAIVHPINTISVRRSLDASVGEGRPRVGIIAFTRSNLASSGIRGLYAGLTAGFTRQIFYTTSQVGIFETLRDEVAKYRPLDLPTRVAVGCASGALAAVVSCPAEVALVRMANDEALPAAQRRSYSGPWHAFTQIWRTEGPLRLFR